MFPKERNELALYAGGHGKKRRVFVSSRLRARTDRVKEKRRTPSSPNEGDDDTSNA